MALQRNCKSSLPKVMPSGSISSCLAPASTVPEVTPVLKFIQHHAKQDDQEAYSTLNMGAGFALFVKAEDAQRTVEVAEAQGVKALIAGRVEAGPKRLLIEPLNIEFGDDALQLR